ncbi:[FeFe] hydrogenase H-cluster radical SAM maturase HydE [uncultured Pseudodesulfovibrio sp.]|uniref:[FeFe] hydrogenase H-cluster radical SAM maturase HydE n=1 Tax=uncultured Pseudodesulfovibrio sp. TaxID=2035858 RepID=UPI0029C7CC33|nr:[FeFe] hydrogenase H-cluster radical SAM maturase HydE [uncultured Pseudodesulfovibrio sp.]
MHTLKEHDILTYLTGANENELFERANATKVHMFGNEVYLRAIIEFSNVCNKKCHYCGLRAPNGEIARYRMQDTDILNAASMAVSEGAGTIVLQSGDDFSYSTQTIGTIISEIKTRHDVAVTLSLGDRGIDEYAFWRDCGADRCLVKLETTNPRIYKRLRDGEEFSSRLHRVESLRALGYEIGSGVIVDLPDSNLISALQDILFLTDLDLDMIAVGPFIPHPQTPLAHAEHGSIELSHRMTAILRILNPHANIPATSALSALEPESQELALTRGCNVLMPSMTPNTHRADYNIYPGKNESDIDVTDSLALAKDMIRSLGFVPSSSKGFSPRRNNVLESTPRSAAGHNTRRTAECRQVVTD